MNSNIDDYLKCSICSTDQHEEQFCRCESRNIRIAKEIREKGYNIWINNSKGPWIEPVFKGLLKLGE